MPTPSATPTPQPAPPRAPPAPPRPAPAPADPPLRAGRWRVALTTALCGTLKGSLRPRSSTLKQVCRSVTYRVPWKAICAGRAGGWNGGRAGARGEHARGGWVRGVNGWQGG